MMMAMMTMIMAMMMAMVMTVVMTMAEMITEVIVVDPQTMVVRAATAVVIILVTAMTVPMCHVWPAIGKRLMRVT